MSAQTSSPPDWKPDEADALRALYSANPSATNQKSSYNEFIERGLTELLTKWEACAESNTQHSGRSVKIEFSNISCALPMT